MSQPPPTPTAPWTPEKICRRPEPLSMLISTTLFYLCADFILDNHIYVELFVTLFGAPRFTTFFDLKLMFACGFGCGAALYGGPTTFHEGSVLAMAAVGGVLLAGLLRYLWWHGHVWGLGWGLEPMTRQRMRIRAHANPRSPWEWRNERVLRWSGRGGE
ncbi:uncharacterized protein BDZ99DRAFT_461695 [Mytilinidion resinicola]|uniref:Uncharacterized protein n=1 Tax=Mytilinidion resinicola TaxID=574789 RepID=A0A6A6YUI5_9PEZI|nr:uncharacterized protein BDZ99DRAFT_461695 [Mytilinidion resinicola]KAF2811694.1 hypothetical protein BDZ99DRAFT_461695 [Mytilinidion resinicola]